MAKYNNSIKTAQYYSAGSEAYELYPSHRYYDKEEKKQKHIKPSVYKKNAVLVHRAKFVLAILLVFCGCIAIMVPHTMIAEQTAKNNELRDELSALKNENISLEADIANKVNLEYVETEAAARLGMSEPQAYQISYIDVPKQSYNVQYDVEEEEINEDKFAFAGLGGLFKKD